MRARLRVAALVVEIAGTLLGAACAGASSDAATFHCSPTKPQPRHGPPPVPFSAASFNYGNKLLRAQLPPHGHLIAGKLQDGGVMARIEQDGSITTKLGWWRGFPGRRLVVSGHRLDKTAAPLKADLPPPNSYGAFIPSGLTFPTAGCWRVSATNGRAHLSFVLLVTKVRSGG